MARKEAPNRHSAETGSEVGTPELTGEWSQITAPGRGQVSTRDSQVGLGKRIGSGWRMESR